MKYLLKNITMHITMNFKPMFGQNGLQANKCILKTKTLYKTVKKKLDPK